MVSGVVSPVLLCVVGRVLIFLATSRDPIAIKNLNRHLQDVHGH